MNHAIFEFGNGWQVKPEAEPSQMYTVIYKNYNENTEYLTVQKQRLDH